MVNGSTSCGQTAVTVSDCRCEFITLPLKMDEVLRVEPQEVVLFVPTMGSTTYFPAELIKAIRNRFFENVGADVLVLSKVDPRFEGLLDNTKSSFQRDAFHKCMKSLTCPQKSRSGMSPQLPSGSRPAAGDFGE
jgi:hypothetical protein